MKLHSSGKVHQGGLPESLLFLLCILQERHVVCAWVCAYDDGLPYCVVTYVRLFEALEIEKR